MIGLLPTVPVARGDFAGDAACNASLVAAPLEVPPTGPVTGTIVAVVVLVELPDPTVEVDAEAVWALEAEDEDESRVLD